MKRLLNIIVFISFVITGCYTTGQIPARDYNNDYNTNYGNDVYSSEVTYQVFYDQLQPYGNWINYSGYGYVWQPNEGLDFRPYETNGHWVSTVDGWAWASDYAWGWAPFHYGRWLNEPGLGWAWVPGYEWAPAWVTWGRFNDYYAWAPLAPGVNISIGSSWRAPYNYWSCVPQNHLYRSNLSRYITRPGQTNVVNNITIINNYNTYKKGNYYSRGPEYQEVELYTGGKITPVGIASANRPGAANVDERQMRIYRPSVTNNTNTKLSAPNRVVTIQELETINTGRRYGHGTEISRSIDDERDKVGNGAINQGTPRTRIIRPNDNHGLYTPQEPMERLPNVERTIITPQELPRTNRAENIDRRGIRQQQISSGIEEGSIQSRSVRPQQVPANDQPAIMERPSIRERQMPGNNQRVDTRTRPSDDNLLQQDNDARVQRQRVFQNNRISQQAENARQNNEGFNQQERPSPVRGRINNTEQNVNRNFSEQRPVNGNVQRPFNVRVRP